MLTGGINGTSELGIAANVGCHPYRCLDAIERNAPEVRVMDDNAVGWVYSPYTGHCEETDEAWSSNSSVISIQFAGEIY